MATEANIEPKNTWQKLLIYWRTKNFSKQVYDIALILAVAIYTNRKIYEEELEQARLTLEELLKDEDSAKEIMHYIEMKVVQYAEDEQLWHYDQRKIRDLITQNEELYAFLLTIFEADNNLDEEEMLFEASLKTALLRQ